MLTPLQQQRYHRQLILPQLGIAGQQKLLQAKVLVIGAGGLGCAILPYLAAAGVGHIGICDDDVVQLHNLHRQVLYNNNQIGLQKASCAADYISRQNPTISVSIYTERLTNKNALHLFQPYDIIADGTDNFATRYLVNDACVLLNKPLVYGAISQFEGQVAVFNYTDAANQNSCNYRDIFPIPPAEDEVPNCAAAGVLGVLPGIIGTMQANEIIKMITGIGKPLYNKLLMYHALDNSSFQVSINPGNKENYSMPGDKTAFEQFDYVAACASKNSVVEITAAAMFALPAGSFQMVDVRDTWEQPKVFEEAMINISLDTLAENIHCLTAPNIITICQSGVRSKKAAILLKKQLNNTQSIYSLQAGIFQLIKHLENGR